VQSLNGVGVPGLAAGIQTSAKFIGGHRGAYSRGCHRKSIKRRVIISNASVRSRRISKRRPTDRPPVMMA
jgi:hypothetical protein